MQQSALGMGADVTVLDVITDASLEEYFMACKTILQCWQYAEQ